MLRYTTSKILTMNPRMGVTGYRGTLNFLSASGRARLSLRRLKLMKMKVSRVPKLKMDASKVMSPLEKNTISAMAMPEAVIVIKGTFLLESLPMLPGSTFFLDIAKRDLDPPIMDDMTTEAVAKRAEIDTKVKTKMLFVTLRRATSRGSAEDPKICQLTAPTMTVETAIYRIVLIKNARRMALGTVFSGSLISSDMTATVENPMKAKKIIAEPERIPARPRGAKGK
jgi:hypothetical protein